jgi:hypothetical protein
MGNKQSTENSSNEQIPSEEGGNAGEITLEGTSSQHTSRTNGSHSNPNRSQQPSASNTSNPSYYSLIKNSYQALVNAIIRPPRSTYDPEQLGPTHFNFCGKRIQRTDFTLVNERNLRFCCSLWEPVEKDRLAPILPCVIYMHGNSSSRLEALSVLSVVLSLGATLLAFDFCGSGLSDGDYVSLGWFEKEDLGVTACRCVRSCCLTNSSLFLPPVPSFCSS